MTQTTPSHRVQYYVMGIDEAGRGPVVGPLVYGTVFCKLEFKDQVKQVFKVKDSKKLTAANRSSIFKQLDEATNDVSYYVSVLEADEISQKMLRRQKYSLNQMSFDCAINLIEKVLAELALRTRDDTSGMKHILKEVYVDTVGKASKYQAMLEEKFPNIDSITVAAKADDLYPIVSASSIVAKVIRDTIVENLAGDMDMGSGYPSDKNTRDWLTANADTVFGFHAHLVRFSWSTITKLMEEEKFASIEWSDDEDEEEEAAKQASVFNFAVTGSSSKLTHEQRDRSIKYRDDFFTSRGMNIVTKF